MRHTPTRLYPLLIWIRTCTIAAIMIRIGIFCDSRSGFLQHFLNTSNLSPNTAYTVFTCKGRRFEELWLQAKHKLLLLEFDHVIVWGGICIITSPYFYGGRKFFWPLKHVTDLAYDLIFAYELVANEVIHLGLIGKVTIMPETGGDLIMYNQIIAPLPWMHQCQADLNYNIYYLLMACKRCNRMMGSLTPWTLDAIYGRTKSGALYPRHSRLYDGLHPSPPAAGEMARKIIRFVHEVYGI